MSRFRRRRTPQPTANFYQDSNGQNNNSISDEQLLNTREQIKATFESMMSPGLKNLFGPQASLACPIFPNDGALRTFAYKLAHVAKLEEQFNRYYGDGETAPLPLALRRLYHRAKAQWNNAVLNNYLVLRNQAIGLNGKPGLQVSPDVEGLADDG